MNCEMVKKGTLDEIIDASFKSSSRPIGVVVFGADCPTRKRVFTKIVDKAKQEFVCDTATSLIPNWSAARKVSLGKNIFLELDGSASAKHGERHQIVIGLRNNGATTVIGVYIKARSRVRKDIVKEQVSALEKHPPTADGLDYLIIVDEQ